MDVFDYIGAPIGGLVGWLAGRRKSNAEILSLEVRTLREVINTLEDHINALKGRISELEREVQRLRVDQNSQ